MTLEQYFKLIVKPTTQKEPTMLEALKAYWHDLFRFEQPHEEEIQTVEADVWELSLIHI